MEGENIDPTVRSADHNLDFARDGPPVSVRAALDVPRAASMDEIASAPVDDERWTGE